MALTMPYHGPVKFVMRQTHVDPNKVTYSYAYSEDYLASLVISHQMYEILGYPMEIETRLDNQ